MTQAQSKRAASLVSADRSDAISSDRLESSPVAASKQAFAFSDDSYAGFVFEEAGVAMPIAATPEPAPEALKRAVEPKVEAPPTQDASSATGRKVVALPAVSGHAAKVPAKVASAPATTAAAHVAEETRKPARDASAPVEPVSASSPPGHGDLDLRAKLNQKEAELLTMRSELSARDRLLLEINEKLVDVERSRLELSEDLEEKTRLLNEAKDKILASEADKEASTKRIADMKIVFRRTEDNWKRKSEADLDALRTELSTRLAEQAAAHAAKLEQLERAHAAELERLNAEHTAVEEQAKERHSEALKNAEASHTQALSSVEAAYTKKARALQDVHEKSLAKAAASHAAALESALAAAAAEKASALAEVEGAHRATQSELSAALNTIQFLERAQATQSARIARQDAKIAALDESLSRATSKAHAAEDTLATLRRTLSAGLSLLNAPSSRPEGE